MENSVIAGIEELKDNEVEKTEKKKKGRTKKAYKVNADMTVEIFSSVAGGFSSVWALTDDEKNQFGTVLAKYYEEKEIEDVSPGFMLLGLSFVYVSKRLVLNETKSKIMRLFESLKKKFSKKKEKGTEIA